MYIINYQIILLQHRQNIKIFESFKDCFILTIIIRPRFDSFLSSSTLSNPRQSGGALISYYPIMPLQLIIILID